MTRDRIRFTPHMKSGLHEARRFRASLVSAAGTRLRRGMPLILSVLDKIPPAPLPDHAYERFTIVPETGFLAEWTIDELRGFLKPKPPSLIQRLGPDLTLFLIGCGVFGLLASAGIIVTWFYYAFHF